MVKNDILCQYLILYHKFLVNNFLKLPFSLQINSFESDQYSSALKEKPKLLIMYMTVISVGMFMLYSFIVFFIVVNTGKA